MCRDLNLQPLEHESPSITTRQELPPQPYFLWVEWEHANHHHAHLNLSLNGSFLSYAEIKLSDWMFQVMWPLLTNQRALFQSSIAMLLFNLFMTLAPVLLWFLFCSFRLQAHPVKCANKLCLGSYVIKLWAYLQSFTQPLKTIDILSKWTPSVTETTHKKFLVKFFIKNGPFPASFSFIFVFSNKHHKFYNKNKCEKLSIRYTVLGFKPGIRTHDLWHMSPLPLPLDQGSRPIVGKVCWIAEWSKVLQKNRATSGSVQDNFLATKLGSTTRY